ncbi:ABC transporter ATP-binding protein [Fundicoccus sp. Sow4_D5]|uniref:ABC transporter ATP-binding protein n=1 Tax=Fundicoccus sp. Sow4_D5 TaxID=3438782 RepID=UPI003F93EE61
MNQQEAEKLLASNSSLIQIKQLNKYYQMGDQLLHVLKNVELTIYKNDFVSIMGPSGSGKSTLINVLGFLDNDFEGDYLFEGKTLEHRTDQQISALRNKRVGFVFQDFNLIANMTVEENVRLPLLYNGLSARQTKDRVKDALDKVGLADKLKQKPSELSGGQKQRVAIARALINQPQFIIADEPTGALDTKTSAAIMAILTNLHKEQGVTIIMVTHDPRIRQFASRHITIVDGVVQAASQDYDQNQLGYLPGDRLTTIDLTGKESRVNDALK